MVPARPAAQRPRLHRAAATLTLALAALAPAAVLAVVTPATWWAATRTGADAGSLLAGLAAAAGWLAVVRLLVVALAASLAGLPGSVGRLARRTATAWSPALSRRLVRAALGAAVVSGPVLSQGAALADPVTYPTLDRVIAMPTAHSPAHERTAPPHRRSAAPGSGHVVVVRPGDTLWAIAAAHLPPGHTVEQVARAWPAWYAANRRVIGPDPGQIRPGTSLVPPPGSG